MNGIESKEHNFINNSLWPLMSVMGATPGRKTMTTITIKGMSCQHCVASTKKALEDIAGISNVSVNLENKQASYDGDVERQIVNDAILKIGFEVTG